MSWKDKMQMLNYGVQAGKEHGAKSFISGYDKYRKYSPLGFFVLLVYAISQSAWMFALVIIGFLHLQVLTNQIWWKLRSIEEFYVKKEDGTNGISERRLEQKEPVTVELRK